MIHQVKVADIHPAPDNPRNNDTAVDAVAASIEAFGFNVPLVISESGEIVAGHTRYKAAIKLGLEEVPCVVADDLSPEQMRAFRLADNKVGELSSWDFEMLETELEEIDMNMLMFGFKEIGAAGMLTEGEELDIGLFDDEEFKYVCKHCGFRFNA